MHSVMDQEAPRLTFAIIQHSIKVFDVPQTIAAQGQRVGTETQAIVPNIKGALPLERGIWVAIRHCHLHQGCPVHYGPDSALILIPAALRQVLRYILCNHVMPALTCPKQTVQHNNGVIAVSPLSSPLNYHQLCDCVAADAL